MTKLIGKIFRNDISRKRWKRFSENKLALRSLFILCTMLFFSFTAEIWANGEPLVLHYHEQTYFPVFKYYHPSVFGINNVAHTDYKAMELGQKDWAIWPVIRWNPFERNEKLDSVPSKPTSTNLFGTDESGRDVFSRLLYGFRYSFGYAIAVWFFASLVGMIAGAIMGFKGGWTDLLGQRLIEILESMPFLMILITLVSIFNPSLWLLAILTVVFGWVSISIYFRSEFLRLRHREFVEAARALGGSRARLIFRHILPNSLTPWITLSPFLIAGNISGLAALDFLGFGLPPPTPSWGELLNEALKNFRNAWWLAVFPSLALFAALTLLNLIGEAVRDALDPRTLGK